MKSRNAKTDTRDSSPLECPVCGDRSIETRLEKDTFPYGEEQVPVQAELPVRTCRACGFKFTDEAAEIARHNAICSHLGLLTPAEVTGIRKQYDMSRAEFAKLTRIGEASLGRWENGLLIQNAAYDQLLYLLMFRENRDRLNERYDEQANTKKRGQDGAQRIEGRSRFPAIRNIQECRRAAEGFSLCKG